MEYDRNFHKIFPIPQKEINANSNIEQKPGYVE